MVHAGGVFGHPGTHGLARWKEEGKGNQMEVAPLLCGRRSNGGEQFPRRPEQGEDEIDESERNCMRSRVGEGA